MESRFLVLDSSLRRWNLDLVGFQIRLAVFGISKPRNLGSRIKIFPHSGFWILDFTRTILPDSEIRIPLGTCQKLAGGEWGGGGVETEGGSQLFETQKREGS